jgi:hypothetical protein
MEEQFNFKKQFQNILFIVSGFCILIIIGIIFISKPGASRIWANVLLNNQYFLGLSLGAAFFLAIHRLALSGWHTLIQRIPDAMTAFIPVAFILMLLICFGLPKIYIWTDNTLSDPVIEGKRAWLNIPFFITRLVIYFIGWIAFTWLMRKNYRTLITTADLKYYNRGMMFAGLFLVFYAVTVSSSSWDWIMSLEPHWYSTIFGWYVLIGMFVTALAFITLMIWFLKRLGYLGFVRIDHIHDLAIYMFCFSIFWTYQWFAQYELIWYGHLPEETSYFITRLHHFRILFFVNLGINFLVPFFGLITYNSKRNLNWVTLIAAVLLIGHWLDYWLMIMPAAGGEKSTIGLFEISMTAIYACVFIFVVMRSLATRPMVVKNDPFLKESMHYDS